MASIKLSELNGSELFQDSESYLNELNEQEMRAMGGKGKYKIVLTSVINVYSQASISQGISLETISIVTA